MNIDQSIADAFAKVAAAGANQIAVETALTTLTYAQLEARSNQIARLLMQDPYGSPIALYFEKDELGIVAMLACAKVGRAYVPLDPSYPPARLDHAMNDSGAQTLLTFSGAQARPRAARTLFLDAHEEVSAEPLTLRVSPETLLFVLYTSGSTGRPKGVTQSHRNVLHFTNSYANFLRIGDSDRLSCLPSYAFGASVPDIYSALLRGATLLPLDLQSNGFERGREWLRTANVTVYHSVPNVFRSLISEATPEQCATVRILDVAGEALTHRDFSLFREKFRPGCQLVNHLAFTECSISAQDLLDTRTQIEAVPIPVGRDAPGVELLLWGDDGQSVAPGEAGEIVVRSEFISPGYIGEPEQNRASFGHCKTTGLPTYRSGDMGRRLPDGRLQHLGRKDFRVKIRGNAVQPLEVEAALLGQAGVKDAVVCLKSLLRRDGTRQDVLVAYLIAHESGSSGSDPRLSLQDRLPAYMIPSFCVWLEKFPTTASGKVDRRALPEPTLVASSKAPRNLVEDALRSIWLDVLKVESVGVDDDFFEIGGDSVQSASILAHIQAAFKVRLPSRALLEAPTIASMAIRLSSAVPEAARREPGPVSTIQVGDFPIPVFITPGGAGNSEMALPFARIARHTGREFSFYCLHHCDGEGEPLPFRSVPEVARHYLAAVEDAFPYGPVVVLGECIGSLLGQELARLLASRHREVHLVVLDPPRTGLALTLRMWSRPYLDSLVYHWNALRRDGLRKTIVARWRRLSARLGWTAVAVDLATPQPSDPVAHSDQLRRCFAAYRRVLRKFRPSHYGGKVFLFLSEEWTRRGDRTRGWENFNEAPLEVCHLSGEHAQYLNDFAPELAGHLRAYLLALQGRAAAS